MRQHQARGLSPVSFAGLLTVLALGCASKDERPASAGTSGTSGSSGSSGTSGSTSGGVPANLPVERQGGCGMRLLARAGAVTFETAASDPAKCTVDATHTTFSWTRDVVTNGVVTRRITVNAVLSQRLSTTGQIGVKNLSVTVQEGATGGSDGGSDGGGETFTTNAIWTMPTGTCSQLFASREYFGIKSSPGDYRYSTSITCTESAAPSNADAQPNTLQLDQLATFTTVQD